MSNQVLNQAPQPLAAEGSCEKGEEGEGEVGLGWGGVLCGERGKERPWRARTVEKEEEERSEPEGEETYLTRGGAGERG